MSADQFPTRNVFDGGYDDPFELLPATPPYSEYDIKYHQSSLPDSGRCSMSGYQFPSNPSPQLEDDLDFDGSFHPPTTQSHQQYYTPTTQPNVPVLLPHSFGEPGEQYRQAQPAQLPYDFNSSRFPAWMTPTVPSNYPAQPQSLAAFPQYTGGLDLLPDEAVAGPSAIAAGYLSPEEAERTRPSRSRSLASTVSSAPSLSHSDVSRSVSPNASEMAKWGYRNDNGSWSCGYPGCSSRSTFNRGCDLRKHYKRHTKSLFCRQEGCPQATEGGFSSKKDRARHEAKHNPTIVCEWDGCDRLFSRMDNMKDHVRRVHRRHRAQ